MGSVICEVSPRVAQEFDELECQIQAGGDAARVRPFVGHVQAAAHDTQPFEHGRPRLAGSVGVARVRSVARRDSAELTTEAEIDPRRERGQALAGRILREGRAAIEHGDAHLRVGHEVFADDLLRVVLDRLSSLGSE